ncbi:Scr1 family TA system antitoxin-like transcriptional regulator [Embleya sp. MST-111070]
MVPSSSCSFPSGPPSARYLENLANGWVSRRAGDVERYVDAFTDLRALAPGPQESLGLIQRAIKEL